MPASHTPFAVLNRTVNPALTAILRSPLHWPLSRHFALITVTGRRTGRQYTFPVSYSQRGDEIRVGIGWPERKRWWRNLRDGGAPVAVVARGVRRTGHAVARGDERSGVVVEIVLDAR